MFEISRQSLDRPDSTTMTAPLVRFRQGLEYKQTRGQVIADRMLTLVRRREVYRRGW